MRASLKLSMIEAVVCNHYEIDPEILHRKCRKRYSLEPRQLFHYFSKKYSKRTLQSIGAFGYVKRDHATVLNSIKKVQNLFDTERDYKDIIMNLDSQLKDILLAIPDEKIKLFDSTKIILTDILSCNNQKELTEVLIKYSKS